MLGYGYQQPEIEVKEITIKNISFGAIKLELGLRVKNPNDYDIKIAKLDYSVAALNGVIASGSYERLIVIPKEGQADVQLPLDVNPGATMRIIGNLLEKPEDDTVALLTSNIEFDTPIGRMRQSFTKEQPFSKLIKKR